MPDRPILPGAVVNAQWLLAHVGHPDLVILDASWYLPDAQRDGRAEFVAARIPGAQYFDFDQTIADTESGLPHMLPSAERFEEEVRRLGLNRNSVVVCYDGAGIFASPRAWWMLKAFGHDDVAVLDGGLPAWRAAGGPIESGEPAPARKGDFKALAVPSRVVDATQVLAAIETGDEAIVDARGAARFSGEAPEPRPGLRSGHMPGARNLPFNELIVDGHLRPGAELAAAFAERGVARETPVITTCGSGVTASVLALALEVAGMGPAKVYDGSWAEWGGRADLPVEQG